MIAQGTLRSRIAACCDRALSHLMVYATPARSVTGWRANRACV